MKIMIGSKNPVKINGAKKAFEQYFENVEIVGYSVESGVPSQPVNDEILKGARNRVKGLREMAVSNKLDIDFFVAIESGITDQFGFWLNTNIAVIEDASGYESIGTSEGFPIPKRYIEEIKQNELGGLMDRLAKTSNIKQNLGGVHFLTRKCTREDLTIHAFTMALTQFVNGDIWRD